VTSTTAFQVRVTLRSFDNIREGRYDALVTNGDYVLPGESGGGGAGCVHEIAIDCSSR